MVGALDGAPPLQLTSVFGIVATVEQVAEITEGAVRLSLGGAAAAELPEYHEPEVTKEPPAVADRSVPLLRRLVLFFQRRVG